jgi:hypothetical protein
MAVLSVILEALKAISFVRWFSGLFSSWRSKKDARKIQDIDAAPADSIDDSLKWLRDDAAKSGDGE